MGVGFGILVVGFELAVVFCRKTGVRVPADLADVGVVVSEVEVGAGRRIDDESTTEAGRWRIGDGLARRSHFDCVCCEGCGVCEAGETGIEGGDRGSFGRRAFGGGGSKDEVCEPVGAWSLEGSLEGSLVDVGRRLRYGRARFAEAVRGVLLSGVGICPLFSFSEMEFIARGLARQRVGG